MANDFYEFIIGLMVHITISIEVQIKQLSITTKNI